MGKHDKTSHILHTSKRDKFVQPKPVLNQNLPQQAPQAPRPGRSSYNMHK